MDHVFGGFCIAVAVVGASLMFMFAGIVSVFDFFYVLPVAASVIALLMPTTRFLAGYVLFFFLGGGILYGQHLYVMSQPSYDGGIGGAIGLAFLALCVVGVVVGAVLNMVFRFGLRRLPSNNSSKQTREKPRAA